MDTLFQPTTLGPLTLKNRIVRSATNEHLSESDGQLTQVWADTLIELARNEVGLIISGHFCVDASQRADEGQPVLNADTSEALLRCAADGVHRYGGKLLLQLSHSGTKAMERVNGIPPKHPEDFTLSELDALVDAFVLAAKRCQDCGMDGVQIHTAHGYLLSNFAIANIGVNRTASFIGISTIISILAAVVVLGEPFSQLQIFAGILVVLGVYVANKT